MEIIDTHSHIVYGIDDGPTDSYMSMLLMEMEYNQGVRCIFCTNHSYCMEEEYTNYNKRFDKLSKLASDKFPGLYLYRGCEILSDKEAMTYTIAKIRNGIFPTMNGTQYVLIEFDSATRSMSEMEYCLESILYSGYIPIIAHAERYMAIYDDPFEDVTRMKDIGCLTQINLYSVEQDNHLEKPSSRKKIANLFLKNNLVDFVGTDAHSIEYKPPEAEIGAAVLLEKYDKEYAKQILFENARTILGTS